MMNTDQCNVRITTREQERYDAVAAVFGFTRSAFLRESANILVALGPKLQQRVLMAAIESKMCPSEIIARACAAYFATMADAEGEHIELCPDVRGDTLFGMLQK